MGTQTMGSQAGVGDSSVPKLPGLSRQGSLYSLTFDEVQNQLGNLGKPLGSLNLDELLRTVEATATQTVDNGGQNLSRGGGGQPGPGLSKQSSISLSRDLKEKTVEELWREIQQQGGKSSSQGQDPERQNTLGEVTLEDFLVQAGIAIDAAAGGGGGGGGGVGGGGSGNDSSNVGQSNLCGGIDPNGGPLTNVAQQHGQWMPYQMLPHQQQHGMMPMFMSGHPVPQPLSVSDTGYSDRQLAVSTSAMMGTLSDTQAVGVGRKRIISGDVVEKTVERRQKRMIKNRESAARSRARKQAYTNELENKVSRLEEENERLRRIMEVEKALPSVPPPPPKHQLRRTNSGPI